MTADTDYIEKNVAGDTADHVAEARQRAGKMLGGEAHLGPVDDWRQSLVSARDALVLIWLTWVALQGFGNPPFTGFMLVAMVFALALLMGISTGRSTYSQIRYHTSELERERAEIRDNFEHEREEVRIMYAAKGFRDPLLDQIVETICADDERLLKVMMEEELGLSMFHINHPLLVGLWNSSAALLAGLALAFPVTILSPPNINIWMPAGGALLLLIISLIAARVTRRSTVEAFSEGAIMAVVTGGVVYFLAQWFAGFPQATPIP